MNRFTGAAVSLLGLTLFPAVSHGFVTTIPSVGQQTKVQRRELPASSSFGSLRSTKDDNNGNSAYDFALLFDCDGVILETEEFHRLAYNAAFEAAGLEIDGEPVEWSVPYYDVLQNTVAGGKGKMFFHFRETTGGKFPTSSGSDAPPETPGEQEELIDALQTHKTLLYKQMVEENAVCRPGVLRLMDEALADPTIAVGVCSASTKSAAQRTLSVTLGQERVSQLDVCILGDDVSEKKPSPMIYNEARKRIFPNDDDDSSSQKCVVIEDSAVGLRAAKSAGMKCLVTYTSSTEREDFYGMGADAKVPDLATANVTLDDIFGPMREKGPGAAFLERKKDPAVPV